MYIIIYSNNDNATSLIYYALQLRKIVLAKRGRVPWNLTIIILLLEIQKLEICSSEDRYRSS